ncbi:MAG: glutamate racemase [Candidatus Kerfeldbacteria bacterium]|nr:glutamate racemase [Candidatus Kerfeldbacteria bacterium]
MIGIVDSGIGGFGVYREVKRLLPRARIVYVADQAHFPYGEKTEAEIEQYLCGIIDIAVRNGAMMVIVACNSASVAALEYARKKFNIPIVGTIPAIKPAVTTSHSQHIGVIGTPATITSAYYQNLIHEFGAESTIIPLACPGLADTIERLEDPRERLETCLAPLREPRVDTLVLACTHYPLIRDEIQEVMGKDVTLLDVSEAVARQAKHVFEAQTLDTDEEVGSDLFVTTGDARHFKKQIHEYGIDQCAVNGYSMEAVHP